MLVGDTLYGTEVGEGLVRLDLTIHPLPWGGISDSPKNLVCRLDLNDPPTAVGGIHFNLQRFCRG